MEYRLTESFDRNVLMERMMGPNAMRISEEFVQYLPDFDGRRILDLGCGMGLSTVALRETYPTAQIIAADLWVAPEENAMFFAQQGVNAIPLRVDATQELPFAKNWFDLIFSVDAYHYFGANQEMLPRLLQYLKPGGSIAVAVPGLKREFAQDIPLELRPHWQEEMSLQFHSCGWWQKLWGMAQGAQVTLCREAESHRAAWADWLQAPNTYAQKDVSMMQAEGGNYFNIVQIVAQRNRGISL